MYITAHLIYGIPADLNGISDIIHDEDNLEWFEDDETMCGFHCHYRGVGDGDLYFCGIELESFDCVSTPIKFSNLVKKYKLTQKLKHQFEQEWNKVPKSMQKQIKVKPDFFIVFSTS